MQIVPQILSYSYKKERSVAFKIRQNPFSAGALPRTCCPGPRWEAYDAPPDPLVGWEGTPLPYLTPLGTDPSSALAMRPPEFQPDLHVRLYMRRCIGTP